MRHRGARIQMTVRLPPDEYREVSIRARGRGWSMSDYVGWCVAKELRPNNARLQRDPLGLERAHPPLSPPPGNRSPHTVFRDFDE